MTVYVFGNVDNPQDNAAILLAKKIKIPKLKFKFLPPHQDLPPKKEIVLIDVVAEIKKTTLITSLEIINTIPSTTVHDFDLGMQLRCLQKIGKLKKAIIIGIPQNPSVRDYKRVIFILRKLVAQDMQGS